METKMYTIKKDKSSGYWQVLTSNGIVQFKSLRRINCVDWVRDNQITEDK